ncbi:MAG TPA: NAD+ synthase [bacterium]|nr:NAD+ synthase [bacterium]HPP86933.1 NAD+ synthase [bacterium]
MEKLNEKITIKKITKWLEKKLKESKLQGFVLGLSGGIDSAVVAALARQTTKKVLCLIMPCHSAKTDVEDAILVAKKLKLKYEIIDLSPIFDLFLKILPDADKLAIANIKPRLRMITLYYYAALNKSLVLGTGNKSELSIGYFTKYGDGGVDLLPIGNFLKREIYQLAKGLNIPQKIIDKPPSAGLWANQTDESEMGLTYAELDETLINLANGMIPKNIKKQTISKIKKMVQQSEHKRQLPEVFKN